MKDKIRSFMTGRYGTDELNVAIIIIAVVFLILSRFFFHSVFSTLAAVAVIVAFFRMMSKDFDARRNENRNFLPLYGKIAPYISFVKAKFHDKGKNKIVFCSKCKKTLRVPKGKGRITLHCPCGNSIKIKS